MWTGSAVSGLSVHWNLERLILILCWWIPYAVAYLEKDAGFLDACKYRVGPVFVRVDFVNVKLCFHFREPEARVDFPKWREPYESRRHMLL
jgi:hypothetical protein